MNFLGDEGIRHAWLSAEVAGKCIDRCLSGKAQNFDGYREELHGIFLAKWQRSERLGMKKYLEDTDSLVDRVVALLRLMSLEEIVDDIVTRTNSLLSANIWRISSSSSYIFAVVQTVLKTHWCQ